MCVCTITVYCGFFYKADMKDVYSDPTTDVYSGYNGFKLSLFLNIVLHLVVIGSNLSFYAMWIYQIILELMKKLRDKNPRLFLLICVFGNRMKLKYRMKQQ